MKLIYVHYKGLKTMISDMYIFYISYEKPEIIKFELRQYLLTLVNNTYVNF